ncbi:MAG TPA: DUF4129 domain-containing protein, partial [Candidatus Dormibacteraeota bacterium]|nr:DUF4129 domain-containing protein [Candidatus Dormibacteraeota bacterium]
PALGRPARSRTPAPRRRAPDAASLDPLLRPFESAVYGGRPVDEETYERAAAVAARFRTPLEQAA